MKERPIIFSTEMVNAILEGKKTQTRRVIKHSKKLWIQEQVSNINKCPYGQVGDRLWVKETHYRYGKWNKNGFTKTGRQKWAFKATSKDVKYFDNPPDDVKPNSYRKEAWYKRPSIFMPRLVFRITLEITGIRVERLQKITEKDAIAEGFVSFQIMPSGIIENFRAYWNFINAKRGYSWESNPWVWVIEFRSIEG